MVRKSVGSNSLYVEYFDDVEKDFKNIHFDEIPIPRKYKDFPNNECLQISNKIF